MRGGGRQRVEPVAAHSSHGPQYFEACARISGITMQTTQRKWIPCWWSQLCCSPLALRPCSRLSFREQAPALRALCFQRLNCKSQSQPAKQLTEPHSRSNFNVPLLEQPRTWHRSHPSQLKTQQSSIPTRPTFVSSWESDAYTLEASLFMFRQPSVAF